MAPELAELLADCYADPGLFHEAVLGRPAFHPPQERFARSVADNKVTVVPTAHAIGKTWSAATLAPWWLFTRPDSLVVTTSPSNNQLVGAMWGSIKAARAGARFRLAGEITSGRATPQVWSLGPKWYAIGFSAGKPESFQGQRPEPGGELLVIVDEASGVEQPIWDAIESLGAARLVAFGNPIRATGHFRTLAKLAEAGTPGYALHRLTAFDSPHAHLTDDEVKALGLPSGLATRSWIERVRATYGEGSLYWRARVLALFPEVDADQLLPAGWVDRCANVARAAGHGGATLPCLAVDISKGTGRDRTVFIVGDLLGLRHIEASSTVDVASAALRAAELSRQYGVRHEHIVYDAGGWAGSDMKRYLEQYQIRSAVGFVGGSERCAEYANLKSRSAWRLRQRLDPDRPLRVPVVRDDPHGPDRRRPDPGARVTIQPPFHIPPGPLWPELREELLELRYRHDERKLALEDKALLAQRLGRSPDLADTLIMLASLWAYDG